ncbi:PREDICTED: stromal cell-derived factor 2-like [Priapulus caudatus]|uniref:Stromal cell-derived factor 2-like n=1 Tax=Priapulus caudatus TaxID=37621 RepID=A0ABM1DPJ3_PRICU|nr:PREDICTED: stromal cell-derived factor 2-like [Priapulus caudatus]XP_014661865.1 PREDICTED: stromal cell-derived factor 2-like [Priapulus caudatus]
MTLFTLISSSFVKTYFYILVFSLFGRNLHSHFFQSPLSHNQEVSCFGEGGDGDTGDNWVVVCSGDHWERNEPIRLRHQDTDAYLHLTGDSYGRPIHGQKEVSGYASPHPGNYWRTQEGVYMMPKRTDVV